MTRTPSTKGVARHSPPSLEGDGETGGWLFEGLEGEEFVAVVFVLFSAQGDLGGQAALQVVDQGGEAVKNGDDFFLNFK